MPRKGLGLECVGHSIAAPSVRIAEVFTPISKDIPVLNLKVDFSSVSEQSDKEIRHVNCNIEFKKNKNKSLIL